MHCHVPGVFQCRTGVFLQSIVSIVFCCIITHQGGFSVPEGEFLTINVACERQIAKNKNVKKKLKKGRTKQDRDNDIPHISMYHALKTKHLKKRSGG